MAMPSYIYYFYNSLPYTYVILQYSAVTVMSDIFGSNVSNADLCYGKQSQITEILVSK